MDIRVMYRGVKGRQVASDITNIVESLIISTSINSQAGKCDVEIVGDGASFDFGSCLSVFSGSVEVFRGFLFSVSMSDTTRFSAVFYDQTRYLRNTDILVFKKITASDLFRDVCSKFNLNVGIVDESSYKLPETVAEGASLWDTLQDAIDLTAAYDKRLFIIRDVAGRLEFRDIETLRTDFVIDDAGVCMGFDYTVGIDENTFNRVKIGYEGERGRNWGIVDNSDYVSEWGILQYYQLLGQKLSKSDLEKRCEQQLSISCWPTRSVRLTSFGDWRVSAGSGIGLNIKSVQAFNGLHHFYVSSCEHHVTHGLHTMDVTLAIDNFGG